MVDLGFYIVTLMEILDKVDATSFHICNPLSYLIVNDREGMFVVWEEIQSVFPIASLPQSHPIKLYFKVDDLVIPSEDCTDCTKAFLCYLVATACSSFAAACQSHACVCITGPLKHVN